MLVDAANLYFRAFYALPESITAPDGRPVNAIRGYLDMTAALIDKRRPTPARRLPRPRLAPGVPGRAGAVLQGAPGAPRTAVRTSRTRSRRRSRCCSRCSPRSGWPSPARTGSRPTT